MPLDSQLELFNCFWILTGGLLYDGQKAIICTSFLSEVVEGFWGAEPDRVLLLLLKVAMRYLFLAHGSYAFPVEARLYPHPHPHPPKKKEGLWGWNLSWRISRLMKSYLPNTPTHWRHWLLIHHLANRVFIIFFKEMPPILSLGFLSDWIYPICHCH